MKSTFSRLATLLLVAAAAAVTGCSSGSKDAASPAGSSGTTTAAAAPAEVELLNVSYDPTRELWRDLNDAFSASYEKDHKTKVTIKQSHGGSGSQARAVIDGLEADVVTLAMWLDVDAIQKAGLIDADWESRLPNRSLPYISTIVFVVRKDNPKKISDWPDLVRDDVKIITPSPKTSGNGKLSFLAAWGSVLLRGGSAADAEKFVTELYHRVPVLDSGARGATTTFAQKGIGDVHLTWENEAQLEVQEAKGALEIVYPKLSIQAEPPLTVVSANVKRKKTTEVADAYLKFLYTDAGQKIIAKHFYRPTTEKATAETAKQFPQLKLFTIEEIAKNWQDAQERFFAEGAIFDRIYQPAKK